jgi:hypothetical protein
MDVGWGVQPEPGVAVVVVDQAKNVWQCCRAASTEGNRVGKSGRYFSVLNCASLKGLSSETCGRLWDWVTRGRRAGTDVTGLEGIEESRSV